MTRPDQQLIEDLSAYLDGELSPERRAEIESLLKTSEAARRELNELRAAADAVADLSRAQAPDALVATMRAHAERSALLGTTRKGRPRGVIWLGRFAATAAVIVGCVLVGREAFRSPADATSGGAAAPLAWEALDTETARRSRADSSAKQQTPATATERGTPAPPVARRSAGVSGAAGVPATGRAISRETARPPLGDAIKNGAVAAREEEAGARLAQADADAREMADSVAPDRDVETAAPVAAAVESDVGNRARTRAAKSGLDAPAERLNGGVAAGLQPMWGGDLAAGGAVIEVRARDAAERARVVAVSRRWAALNAGSYEIASGDEQSAYLWSMSEADGDSEAAHDTPFMGGAGLHTRGTARDAADVQQFAINVSQPALPRLLTALENAAPDQVSVTLQNWSADAVLALESSDEQHVDGDLHYFASRSAATANAEASEPAVIKESAAPARAERGQAAEPRDAGFARGVTQPDESATRGGRLAVEEAPAASGAKQQPVDWFFGYFADQLAFLGQAALTRPPTVPVQVMIVGPEAPRSPAVAAPAAEAPRETDRQSDASEEARPAEGAEAAVGGAPSDADE